MLIESVAGLIAVRCRTVALRLGDAVGEPLFGGVAFGLAVSGALASEPKVDDLSHAQASVSGHPPHSAPITPIRWRGVWFASGPYQNAVDTVIWATHG